MADEKETKKPEAEAQQPEDAKTENAPEEATAPEAKAGETKAADGKDDKKKKKKDLKDALAQKEAELAEQKDQHLRLMAEYDNYRKRTQKEKEASWANAKAETIKELLPVYDNLARALQQKTEDEAYAKGVEMIMTQMKNALEKLGVEAIPAAGQTFDPNLHNAVMHVDDEDLGENVVVEVFQDGFKLGDKIIRHAMVKVAN